MPTPKRTAEEVLGRYLAKKNFEEYQQGDFGFDAKEIIRALSRAGYRITRRKPR